MLTHTHAHSTALTQRHAITQTHTHARAPIFNMYNMYGRDGKTNRCVAGHITFRSGRVASTNHS